MGRIGSRLVLWAALLGMASVASAQQPSIQFAEPVHLSLKASQAQFDAYGRRFSLNLVNNDRVLAKLSAQRKAELAPYRMLRGSVEGAPGSWVRLTETPDGVEGAIWDGHDLYAVTRYESIEPFLTTPLNASPGQTVVYRLSDARQSLPRNFCALSGDTAESQVTGLDQYNAIVSEIEAGVLYPSISRQIEISLLADTAFQQAESGDPTAAMLARFNIVEGIFSEQVGLLVLATDVRLMPMDADPFTSTKGSSLLEQLSTYRKNTPAVKARGLAHLMTGKDLDGTTAGIAYVRTVCDDERAVSLSQRSYGTTISALIMAHELGHNFGAEHDGEPGGACAGTGDGFIMAPSVSGYSTFSQCSLDSMAPVIAAASCITPAQFSDVAVDAAVSSVSAEGGVPFTMPFLVRSTGNLGAQDVVFTLTLPNTSALSIDSATSNLGSCSVSGSVVTCAIGALGVDDATRVEVVARTTAAMNINAQARVSATNDRLSSNNNRTLSVQVRSGVDAAVTLTVSASEVALGAPLQVFADVSAVRALPLRNATLSLNLNQPVGSASMSGASCTVNASSVSCSIAELPAGQSRRLTVSATAQTAGSMFASATVSVAGDGDLSNNSTSATAWVQAERDVEIKTYASGGDLAVGTAYDIPYTVRSRGPLATGDVTLQITLPVGALVVEALDTGGAPCTVASNVIRCDFGALAPGASRPVLLRVRGTGPVAGDVNAVVTASDDGYLANNAANVSLRIDHAVDLGLVLASGGSGVEDAVLEGQVTVRSNGKQTVSGATMDVDLHAAGTLLSASIHNGAACNLLSETRARCALPAMGRNAQVYVDYTARFAEPGEYNVDFSVAAAGDTAPANDSLTRLVLVRPFLDIAVAGTLTMDALVAGQQRVKTFTVTTDRRPLASARFAAGHASPALTVESIASNLGGAAHCRVEPDFGGICDFADLPANASVTVTVTYRAGTGSAEADAAVSVSTPGDVASTNNAMTAHVQSYGATDLELRVGGTMAGARSATMAFPVIELVNGNSTALSPSLEVTLPAELTLVSVSASDAICSGSTTIRCDFSALEANSTARVNLSVRSSASGSFVSRLRVQSANDNNPANDSRDVVVEVSAVATTPAPAPPSGGGGGGRMEWLGLLLLGALAVRKWGHSRFPGNGDSPLVQQSGTVPITQ